MLEDEAYVLRQFGRAFKLMEGWIEAELLWELREAVLAIFGNSLEYKILRVLLGESESLPLYEIALRCRMSRRAVFQDGRIRGTLSWLAKQGILINTGTEERPRYLLNRGDARTRFIEVMIRDDHQATGA